MKLHSFRSIRQPLQADESGRTPDAKLAETAGAVPAAAKPASAFAAAQGDSRTAPSLTPPEFEQLAADLAGSARYETALFGLRRLAGQGGKLGDAAASLAADSALAERKLPAGAAALAAALGEAIGARTDRATGKAAQHALTEELTAFRYGALTELGFAVEKVTLPDSLPPPRNLASTQGVDPAVAGLPLADHSMHDVGSYVDERLGGFLVKDLVQNDRRIEIHQGSTEHAFASLKQRGFTELFRVRGPKTADYGQLYLARNAASGEVRYAMTNNWGTDRIGHMQKLVSFAAVSGPEGPRRIRPGQIEVFADPLLHPEQVYKRYSRALLRSGTVPVDVVVGFKSGMLRELGRRGVAARQVEHLQQTLGPDPMATLRARAAAAGAAGKGLHDALLALGDKGDVMALEPSRVFRHDKHIVALREVEQALVALAKDAGVRPLVADVAGEGGFSLRLAGRVAERVGEDRFIDQSMISYVDADGAARSLLISRNPYGDLAHEMGRVLVDNDVENIFVVGTAGGLKADGKVGEVHVPTELVGADGEVLPFENSAIEFVVSPERKKQLGSLVKVGTSLLEVNSPLDETKAWVNTQRAGGYDIVEMELADLVRATKGSDTRVAGMYIVSDIPGTEHTLESQSAERAREGLAKIGDVLVAQLGIRDVSLVTDERVPTAQGFAGAEVLASRMLAARGLDGDEHLLMRNNLARYLYNGLSDASLVSLQADEKSDPLNAPQLASRWREKAVRALGAPFVNDDVIDHLRELGRGLGNVAKLVGDNAGPDAKYTFHILGSIVKGRAGAGSDVDMLIRSTDTELKAKLFESEYGYAGAPDGALVVAGDYDYAMSRGNHYGPVIEIGDGAAAIASDTVLVELYAEALKGQGLLVDKNADGDFVVRKDPAGVTTPPERETEAIAERVLEYEKAYRKWMNTDFLLRHLKDVAPLADVGHLPFERLVAQGEKLIAGHLKGAVTPERVHGYLSSPEGARLLQSPRGAAFLERVGLGADELMARLTRDGVQGLPLERLVDGQMAAALVGRADPLAALGIDFAAAERAREQHGGRHEPFPLDYPFFAAEVQAATRSGAMAATANPMLALLAHRTGGTGGTVAKPAAAVLEASFFDRHMSQGTGERTVGVAKLTYGADGVGRVDVRKLAAHDELFAEIVDFAQQRGVTIGFWGGSARDLLLGRTRDKTSDIDLVYDTSEPQYGDFKDELIGHLRDKFGRDNLPEIDFSVDKSPTNKMRGPYRGLTMEKLGVMVDGKVADFTGRGVEDLAAGVLRYNSSEPFEPPGISSLFRMVGAQIQNRDMAFDDKTRAVMAKVMKEFYGPGSQPEADLRGFRQKTKHMRRREVSKFVRKERKRLGGRVPGSNLVDFFRTLGKIVKGGVQADPARSLRVLEEFGLVDFLERIDAGDRLQPLRDAVV